MKNGAFKLSEIEELFNVVDQFEVEGIVYNLYSYWKTSFDGRGKLLVNITDGWYVYTRNYTALYVLEHINEFKHFKLKVR